MPRAPDTNVRILSAALDALSRVAVRWGLSRDETIRRLLSEHLVAQESVDDELQRLTHVSTVMRYPAPLPGRNQPRQGVQLRLRLDEGVADRARAVSLRLPGQYLRGHRDYQARLITDAVMTAIARQEPIIDDVLDGVLPLLRHGAALGLWRLTAAAICTQSELEVYELAGLHRVRRMTRPSSEPADHIEQLAAALREEDVAWHAAYRSTAAQFLVRKLLPVGSETMEEVLFEQSSYEWETLLLDLTHRNLFDNPIVGFERPWHDYEGRGAAAVWRGERLLERHAMLVWLRRSVAAGVTRSRVVRPPGWKLGIPDGWRPAANGSGLPLPPDWCAHLDAGRVLNIGTDSRPVLWPTVAGPGGQVIPVPRFDLVTAAAPSIQSDKLIEVLLVQLEFPTPHDESDDDLEPHPDDDSWELQPITTTAHRAFNLGLIDEAARDAAVDHARVATQAEMRRIIASLCRDDELRTELRAAMNEPSRFAAIARRAKRRLYITTTSWTWPITSLAAAVADDTVPAPAVEYLAQMMIMRCRRRLERSMERASRAAFDRFGYDPGSIL